MEVPVWEKRKLGRTGMVVTPVGIGGAYLGRQEGRHDEQVAVDTVLCGLELGINLIDTSGMYIGFSRPSRVREDVAACFAPIGDDVWRELHDEFGL